MTSLITELRRHNSTLVKQQILSTSTTEEDKKLFKWTYDPFKRYKLHFDYVNMDRLGIIRDELFFMLNDLASGKLSGNYARVVVDAYCKDHGDLIKLVCNKDLDCGVSTNTLNKVFGNDFIPKFAIQLAKEENIDKIKLPILGQIKYNGARVLAIIDNGIITFKSRGGHEFSFPELSCSLIAIKNRVAPFIRGLSFVLDGELTFGDSQNEDHTKVSGLVNSAIKGTPISNNLGLIYNVFDCIDKSEFDNKICSLPYNKRLCNVEYFILNLDKNNVRVATTYMFETVGQIEKQYAELISNGYEGLILKAGDSKYTYKKNKTWIKMKATDTADLLCTGYNEGTGKYEGAIGSLICEGKIDGKLINVNVGSGLNDNDRQLDPQKYIGKTIEVAYNKVIQDSKTYQYSLFLPRFLQVRGDKC